jgi:hypothetical protein
MSSVCYGLQNSSIRHLKLNRIFPSYGVGNMLMRAHVQYMWTTRLEKLELDCNRIQLVENGAISALPRSLHTLSVRGNMFQYGPYFSELVNMTGLRVLDASSMVMSHVFPLDQSCLSTKKHLQPGSTIVSVPPHLTAVDISNSNIKHDLNNMNLTTNKIASLNMSGNLLYEWYGPIQGSQTLEHLDLSHNYCSYVSRNFFNTMVNLRTLVLNHNVLGRSLSGNPGALGYIFKNLSRLEYLDLSKNRINYLKDDMFIWMKGLRSLNLSGHNLGGMKRTPVPSLAYSFNITMLDYYVRTS